MKKFIVFLIGIAIIVATISYMYLNYKAVYKEAKIKNAQYESYENKEIYGTDLATLINKAVDDNAKNEVQKDEKGNYINNEENSIRIDIKFIDDDKIHSMGEIYRSGTDLFVRYYNQIKFKCTSIEKHAKTGRIKYMFFEQISN